MATRRLVFLRIMLLAVSIGRVLLDRWRPQASEDSFVPPDARQRSEAIGTLDSLSPLLRRAFTPSEDFAAIPIPGPSDWLACEREYGQTFATCLMNGSNHLDESDSQPLHLCPVCLRKLQYSIGFDLADRYRQLASVCKRLAWADDAQWYLKRLQYIEMQP